MWIVLTKWRLLSGLGLLSCMLVAVISLAVPEEGAVVETFATTKEGAPFVIVDPGHGGEDGGAVSSDGVIESQINLAIASDVYDVLQLLGVPSVMTRETDISLHDDDADTIRAKKVSDLENRVAFINGYPQAMVLSIHQNSLPSSTVTHGAQCFYNPTGEAMATAIQAVLNQTINPGNEKAHKAIDSSIYLMANITVPGVIIECGFLTNEAETALLQTQQHQMTLALSIAAGYGQSLELEETP